jgi:hypothetical protein
VITPRALSKAMTTIEKRMGPFTVFALVTRTDSPGHWQLVVSAPWLESGKLRALSVFARLLAREIGDEELGRLARLSALPEDHPVIQRLSALNIEGREIRLVSSDLRELSIEEAIVLRAKRPS